MRMRWRQRWRQHSVQAARTQPTCDPGATADALGDVVSSHLQVQTARDGAALLVHIEECLHLLPTPLA